MRIGEKGEGNIVIMVFLALVCALIFGLMIADRKPRDPNLVRCKTTKVIPYEQCYGKKRNRTCGTQYRHEVHYKWCTKEEAEGWASMKIYVPNEPPKKEKKSDEEQLGELIVFCWLFF